MTLREDVALEFIIITKFSILDVCGKLLTIVAKLLDVLVIFAMFIKYLICTSRYLEKIYKYGERKEIKPFPLIQSIAT